MAESFEVSWVNPVKKTLRSYYHKVKLIKLLNGRKFWGKLSQPGEENLKTAESFNLKEIFYFIFQFHSALNDSVGRIRDIAWHIVI